MDENLAQDQYHKLDIYGKKKKKKVENIYVQAYIQAYKHIYTHTGIKLQLFKHLGKLHHFVYYCEDQASEA